jgi:zinc protease
MTLLLNILVDGDSSRLHQIFVEEEQLAVAVGGLQFEGFDPGLVYFYLVLPPDGDLDAIEARMFEELQRVVAEGVTADELTKARNIMLADFWRELATIDGKAEALGRAAVFHGAYERLFDLPQEIEAVSTDDLRAVAAAVLRRSNATIGVLRAPVVEAEE